METPTLTKSWFKIFWWLVDIEKLSVILPDLVLAYCWDGQCYQLISFRVISDVSIYELCSSVTIVSHPNENLIWKFLPDWHLSDHPILSPVYFALTYSLSTLGCKWLSYSNGLLRGYWFILLIGPPHFWKSLWPWLSSIRPNIQCVLCVRRGLHVDRI